MRRVGGWGVGGTVHAWLAAWIITSRCGIRITPDCLLLLGCFSRRTARFRAWFSLTSVVRCPLSLSISFSLFLSFLLFLGFSKQSCLFWGIWQATEVSQSCPWLLSALKIHYTDSKEMAKIPVAVICWLLLIVRLPSCISYIHLYCAVLCSAIKNRLVEKCGRIIRQSLFTGIIAHHRRQGTEKWGMGGLVETVMEREKQKREESCDKAGAALHHLRLFVYFLPVWPVGCLPDASLFLSSFSQVAGTAVQTQPIQKVSLSPLDPAVNLPPSAHHPKPCVRHQYPSFSPCTQTTPGLRRRAFPLTLPWKQHCLWCQQTMSYGFEECSRNCHCV